MSLIQIAAQELAAPGMHRHKTNTPCEFSATADRADNSVSLTPTAFLLWDQVECQFSLTSSHDCMAELSLSAICFSSTGHSHKGFKSGSFQRLQSPIRIKPKRLLQVLLC
jgi:hypothetical protein